LFVSAANDFLVFFFKKISGAIGHVSSLAENEPNVAEIEVRHVYETMFGFGWFGARW
jgi:hypothetical protein